MTVDNLAIVTVSFGSEAVLPAFLDSIPTATNRSAVVVVADNKTDTTTTAAMIVKAHKAQYLPLPDNRGYGHAINAAVAALGPEVEWIVVSNPDVVLGAGSIDTMLDAALVNPRIGAVGPSILNPDGSVYPSAREIPSFRTGIGHALFANVWPANPWSRKYRNEHFEPTRTRQTGWLSGSCLLVRRSAFAAVHGFDESFFMYFEDVDLGYRLGKAGYVSLYEPRAAVMHAGAHATASESKRMIRAHHESARLFIARRYRGPLLWPVRAVAFASLWVRSMNAERRARP